MPGISPQFGASTAVNLGSAPPVPMLYFCIPRNDKLLGYWDTVADRLLCGDLKSLGSALLTALEKKDAEELALLRQGQEIAIQKAAADIAKLRIDEAKEQLSALRESKKSAEFRRDTYDDREFMNVAESS